MNGTAPSEITLEVIDAMAQTKAGWVRLWLNWYQIEHDSGVYDWTGVDSIINVYTNYGFEIFATLQGGNQFYDTLSFYPDSLYPNPQYGTPPIYLSSALNAWIDFVTTAVNRYKDRIKHWSIWNEPNIQQYWPPKPDSMGYLDLVRATVPVIRSIDPSAKIITGNTSLIDFEYLSAIIDSLIPYTDYIGFHPYRLYPEDDQDNFPVANLIVDSTPFGSFDGEMDSLLKLLRSADPTGRVKLWDEESGYPSHPEPILWDSVHICDTVQMKNLLRKYLLDFAYFVEVSTYWGDYDINSNIYNALGENWRNDFYDMTIEDWEAKEYTFLFNYIAITYTPQGDTVWKEAEDYDTISGNLFLSQDSSYILYPDSFQDTIDPSNFVKYTISVPKTGNYTLWLRMRNPDTTKIPVWLGYFDTNYFFFVTTRNPYDSLNRFIWMLPFDSESLRLTYWTKGPHFFSFEQGTTYTLTIIPYYAGSELDKIGLKREAPPSVKKLSWYAMRNLADIWDGRWIRDTLISFEVDSGNIPSYDWQERRVFIFQDTTLGSYGVVFWLGVPPYDDFYPDYQIDLTLETTNVNEPVTIDFRDGSITPVNYTLTDTTVIFSNLPISDVPRFLALDINSVGIVERNPSSSGNSFRIVMLSSINREELVLKFSLPISSEVRFSIYDIAGRRIKNGSLGKFSPGVHRKSLSLKSLHSAVYFLSLKMRESNIIKKFVIVR